MKLFARLLPRFAVFLLAAATLRCTDGEPVDPNDGGTIEAVSGDGQDATVGTTLPDSLIVRVLDQDGAPLSGIIVEWEAQGGGSVSEASTESGADGRTGIVRTLGMTAGEQTTVATSEGLDGSPIMFTATATESPPGPVVEVVTQPPASALDGEVFAAAEQPAVRVLTDGVPVEGATVTASLASGSGTLDGQFTAVTDAAGIARFGDLGIAGEGEHTIEFTAPDASITSNPITLSALPAEATTGEWGPEVAWNIVPLHMSLLPNGKILAWGREEIGGGMGHPRLWDPATQAPAAAQMIMADTMLFCAGHTLMPDGNLMVSGGHKADDRGLDVTNIFNWQSASWTPGLPKMAHGRWYPTVTTLPDGRLVTVAGQDSASNVVRIPEIWENGAWVELPGADNVELPYYPRDFIDPTNGLVFMAGERIQSRWLDVDGFTGPDRGQWIPGPAHVWPFNRDYGSAVMYESGKILYVGGGGYTGWDTPDNRSPTPTATAEKIDLTAAGSWTDAGSMSQPRRHHTATVLPDGKVLVTGGVSGGGFNDVGSGVRAAEIWNPSNNSWSTLASNAVTRAYHSVSILMPDGTVLHGASGDANIPGTTTAYPAQRSHEIFRPPYLFKGARPEISTAPASVGYGQSFDLTTGAAGQITDVRLIRLGSVTHAFDMGTMAVSLDFTKGNGSISVTAPASSRIAPPGHYQIFVLNRNGVPSEGRIVQVQ
ncbi:MAG TPA: galactose oxidase-like domain-containing protein [Gemmatimonadales bacterium]|nr:galactose oxidase-like domain-containing protein [Gemmatimonadales bacterium]